MSSLSITTQVEEAASALHNGGIIAYPTEAVYGLGCLANDITALEKLIQLKQRDPNKGLILIASNIEQLYDYIEAENFNLHPEIKTQWPGAITWILPCKQNTLTLVTGNRKTLAVRVSAHPVVQAICNQTNQAMISTSANPSTQSPAINAQQVADYFPDQIDYIIDAATGQQKNVTPIFDALTGKQIR